MGKLRIRQVRSAIRREERQKRTVRALGLRRLHHTVVVGDTPQIRGMIKQVRHLVTVEEIAE
ncbi:MAG: 50S ribosomal protein L30 [Candidatus Eisenbacteria bacterium]|nr:50S ribosomal protein L30 [Candidatus Eisenbacteria bacterium]